MANKIKGLTVAIQADTSGVTKGLEEITSESVKASNNLKSVNALLKLDPTNTDLLAEKELLLADAVAVTSKKLELLKAAQEDVNRAFDAGTISDAEYIAFQKELVQTQKRLEDLTKAEEETGKETDTLGTQFNQADKDASALSDTFRSGLVIGAQAAAAAVAAVGTAAIAAVTGVVKLAGETAALGDDIDKNSQKLGMSAQSYQEWAFIMEHSGSDIDKMSTAMKKLADAATEPSNAVTAAFGKIGMSMDEIAGMSQEELFSATITALQGMESGAERTAIANDLLGKSAMDLGALLNTSAEDTEAMRQQLHDLGGMMSDEAVRNAATYQDSLQNLNVAIDGIKNGIASDFIPAITSVMDGISGILSGSEDGLGTFLNGIEAFTDQIGETVSGLREQFAPVAVALLSGLENALPGVLELGTAAILQLAQGAVQALPGLAGTAVDIVTQLSDGILKLLPDMMRAGVNVLTALVSGISRSIPTLIPAAASAVTAIVQGLSDNLPQILGAALSLVEGLAEGLYAALPVLLDSLPTIVESLANGLLSGIPQIMQTGVTVLTALTEALPEIIGSITSVLPEIITAIMQAFMQNTPQIVSAGFDLLTALTGELPEIIAQLVIAIPVIVAALGEAVTSLFPQMGQYGMDLFSQLTERGEEIRARVAELIPRIIDSIGSVFMEKYADLQRMGMNLFDNVAEGIRSVLSGAWNWGADLISNFVSGIRENIASIISAATDVAGTIRDYLGFSEPEKGPLSDFHTFAPDMMRLFADGIRDSADIAAKQLDTSLAGVVPPVFMSEVQFRTNSMDTIPDLSGAITARTPNDPAVSVPSVMQMPDIPAVSVPFEIQMPDLSDLVGKIQDKLGTLPVIPAQAAHESVGTQAFADAVSEMQYRFGSIPVQVSSPVPAAPAQASAAQTTYQMQPILNVNVEVGSITGDYDVQRMTDRMIEEISAGLAQLQSRQTKRMGG